MEHWSFGSVHFGSSTDLRAEEHYQRRGAEGADARGGGEGAEGGVTHHRRVQLLGGGESGLKGAISLLYANSAKRGGGRHVLCTMARLRV